MKGWASAIKGFLTADECQRIIGDAQAFLPVEPGKTGHGGVASVTTLRSSEIRWIARDNMRFRQLWAKIESAMSRVNAENFGANLIGVPYECQFTEYHADAEGKYDWHEDNSPLGGIPCDRLLSFICLLSHRSMFDGGNLELDRNLTPKLEVFGNQGDAIIFRSDLKHRVTNVTRGDRYSIVVWWRGR